MLLGFDHGGEDDVNQTSRRTNTVHTFTAKETKRRLSCQRTNYEERAGRGREGHTRLLKKQRGPRCRPWESNQQLKNGRRRADLWWRWKLPWIHADTKRIKEKWTVSDITQIHLFVGSGLPMEKWEETYTAWWAMLLLPIWGIGKNSTKFTLI